MLEWYWGLQGWELLAATLGCIVAAFAGIIGLAGGLAKWVFDSFEHDKQTCGCHRCQGIRAHTWQRRYDDPARRKQLISTLELSVGMRVISSDGKRIYIVSAIEGRSYGRLVFLRNRKSDRESMVTVRNEHLNKPMWRLTTK